MEIAGTIIALIINDDRLAAVVKRRSRRPSSNSGKVKVNRSSAPSRRRSLSLSLRSFPRRSSHFALTDSKLGVCLPLSLLARPRQSVCLPHGVEEDSQNGEKMRGSSVVCVC